MSAIPAELRALPNWIRWKSVPDTPKPRKIPIRPAEPGCASSTDPSTWGTFEEASANVGQHGTCGIGFVFAGDYFGIDIDNCLAEEGKPDVKAAGLVAAFATYTEISPSGFGLHLIGRGSLNGHRGMNRSGIELYDQGRYFTMTGTALPGTASTIAACQPALDALVAELDPPRPASPRPLKSDYQERARAYVAKMPAAISGQGGHDATFRVALALVKGFSLDSGTALDLLREFNSRCGPPWSEKELLHKVEDAVEAEIEDGYIIGKDAPRSPRTADRLQVDPKAPLSPWIDLNRFREELRQITRTRRSTGIPTLDHATEGGTSGGQVVLLVGPPGSAKSALAHAQATARARALGRRAYVYSPDQGGTQPLKRLATTCGNVAEDDDAFARLKNAADVLRIIDERLDGVTIESFRDLVLAAGADVAAVVIDTPQTVATLENEEERQRIEKSMSIAREIAEKLLVPVFVCSHANRAATAARNKENRTLERSAGLGGASLEHRAQVVLFMERRDGQEQTEIDVLVTKAAISGLRFRLLLDVETWGLREIDIEDESATKAEHVKKARDEKRNAARTERREAIMAVVLAASTDAGASLSSIRERYGKTETLAPTLAVMVEEGLLESLDGPKPPTGGRTPVHYRLKKERSFPGAIVPREQTSDHRSFPPVPLGYEGTIDKSAIVPDRSRPSFSTGTIDGNNRPTDETEAGIRAAQRAAFRAAQAAGGVR